MNVEFSNSGKDQPLVSIIVITYKSSKFILETLESIKNQTYENIELIVSDDCSPDETVSVVENWVQSNRNRFVAVNIVTTPKNTGIAPNCNRGLFAAKGEWVKLIAGDDLLFTDAIERLIEYTLNNNSCKVIFGRIQYLKNGTLTVDTIPEIFQLEQKAQIVKNLKGSSIKAPSSFLHRDTLISVGGFDERYPMIEDVPMWVKLSLHGHKFYFVDAFITKYRIHNDNISVSNAQSRNFVKEKFYKNHEKMITTLIIPGLRKEQQWMNILELINYVVIMRLILLFGNRNTLYSKALSLLIINKTLKMIISRMADLRKTN